MVTTASQSDEMKKIYIRIWQISKLVIQKRCGGSEIARYIEEEHNKQHVNKSVYRPTETNWEFHKEEVKVNTKS